MTKLTPELVREKVAAGTLELCAGKCDVAAGMASVMQAERLYLGLTPLDGKEDYDPERPVLGSVSRLIGSDLTAAIRARLVPYVAKIAESPPETKGMRRARSYLIADSARLRAALELDCAAVLCDREDNAESAAQCWAHAAHLRALAEVRDEQSAHAMRGVLSALSALNTRRTSRELSALDAMKTLAVLWSVHAPSAASDLNILLMQTTLKDLHGLRGLDILSRMGGLGVPITRSDKDARRMLRVVGSLSGVSVLSAGGVLMDVWCNMGATAASKALGRVLVDHEALRNLCGGEIELSFALLDRMLAVRP